MNRGTLENDDFNSLNVFHFIYLWRKQLVTITIASVILSSIIALNISDKYEASVIHFPATTNSISKILLTENNFQKEDILQFGQEEDAEQMLQILKSDEIRTRICENYNLMEHYDIDSTDKLKRTKLYKQYHENITFKLTEHMSVRIDVLDVDPDISASIANSIANLYDSTKIHIQHARAMEALKICSKEYFEKDKEVKKMTDSIRVINGLGIFDYESQSERTVEQYNIALQKGNDRVTKLLDDKLKIIAAYGSAYVSIRDNLFMQRKQLNLLKTKYEEAQVDAKMFLPQKFVVSYAYPAEEKSYPIRWLIVVISVISTLLLSVIAILIFENFQHMTKNKLKKS